MLVGHSVIEIKDVLVHYVLNIAFDKIDSDAD